MIWDHRFAACRKIACWLVVSPLNCKVMLNALPTAETVVAAAGPRIAQL
jgi:hypothetical protein